jgi:hypothetical protein
MSVFILGPGADATGDLRRFAEEVAPVVHEAVARARAEVDAALVAMIEDDTRLEEATAAVDRLAAALLPHLRVELDHLLDPITDLGIRSRRCPAGCLPEPAGEPVAGDGQHGRDPGAGEQEQGKERLLAGVVGQRAHGQRVWQ